MLTNGEFYRDPGADYYTATRPAQDQARAVKQLEALGYESPSNHSPNPPDPPPNWVTCRGHLSWSPNFHVSAPREKRKDQEFASGKTEVSARIVG